MRNIQSSSRVLHQSLVPDLKRNFNKNVISSGRMVMEETMVTEKTRVIHPNCGKEEEHIINDGV